LSAERELTMAQFTYRLQLLLEQKQEARNNAERELKTAEQEHETQLQTVRTLERRQQEITERREQLRRELLTKPVGAPPLTAREAQDRAEYVRVLAGQIEEAKQAVLAQRDVVDRCKLRVQEANIRLEAARREVEVLTKHRARQEERFVREARTQEENALDEIGNVLYTTRRRSA
jgi:flagellar biosynthesis chaperone FliJ